MKRSVSTLSGEDQNFLSGAPKFLQSAALYGKNVVMYTIDIPLNEDGILDKISKPDLPKYGIYVVRNGREVIRIGESSSGFDRISKGFRQKLRHIRKGRDKKNYLAYSWRDNYRNTTLNVDYFTLEAEPFSENHIRRALEAEITFQFRIAMRSWPRNMSEIHFLERYRENVVLVAKAAEVMKHYGHKYNVAV